MYLGTPDIDFDTIDVVELKSLINKEKEQHNPLVMVDNLKRELAVAKEEISILNTAITMLKLRLDQHEIPYFEEKESEPLTKKPQFMTQAEIKERNKEVTLRQKTRAKSLEALTMPTYDEELENYSKKPILSPDSAVFQCNETFNGIMTRMAISLSLKK
ncbi:MAG TPA: hypothetical protein VN855_00415 [Candidatus Acidoferrum sp.]|nr:hypothetical protein [Candidatus Acidoferrum sp.]